MRWWTLLLMAVLMVVGLVPTKGETRLYEMYIVCQPGDYVNARIKPSTRSESLGRLDTGYSLMTDGKTKNGFLHCPHLLLENNEGWVYAGYLVDDPPVESGGAEFRVRTNGRVACRKCIDGERRCWVNDGDIVKVWYWTREWCVTNRGFVQTKYLERSGE